MMLTAVRREALLERLERIVRCKQHERAPYGGHEGRRYGNPTESVKIRDHLHLDV